MLESSDGTFHKEDCLHIHHANVATVTDTVKNSA